MLNVLEICKWMDVINSFISLLIAEETAMYNWKFI